MFLLWIRSLLLFFYVDADAVKEASVKGAANVPPNGGAGCCL